MIDDMAESYAALERMRQELDRAQKHRTIYLVRHGSTELNDDQDCIRGWKNVPLSTKGWKEAFSLAKKLKTTNIGIIFTSDLDRAVGTANAIAGQKHVPITKTILLRPWNLGEYTGKPFKEVDDQIRRFAEELPTLAVPGGESFIDFKNRAFNGLRFALANSRGLPVVISTHHRVERLFKSTAPDQLVDLKTMFQKGEPPGGAEKVTVNLVAIAGAQPTSVYAGASVIGPDKLNGH